jgi:hypothetical protein
MCAADHSRLLLANRETNSAELASFHVTWPSRCGAAWPLRPVAELARRHARLSLDPLLIRPGELVDAAEARGPSSPRGGNGAPWLREGSQRRELRCRRRRALEQAAAAECHASPVRPGGSSAEMSVLVHEMVHHLQNQVQLKYRCPQEREKLAYAAQDRWLSHVGTSLEKEFGIDPFTLLVKTNCFG